WGPCFHSTRRPIMYNGVLSTTVVYSKTSILGHFQLLEDEMVTGILILLCFLGKSTFTNTLRNCELPISTATLILLPLLRMLLQVST
ncbi:hypothetical protein BU16DRAFT_463056, partial [Lophium mytilinum]